MEGMRLVKVSPEIKWNMSDALDRAPREAASPAKPPAAPAAPESKADADEPEPPVVWDRE